MRLVVELFGERTDDLVREPLPADLREEVVEVLSRVLFVFREDLDDVLEGLALEFVELLALRRVDALARVVRRGGLEDADEAPGGFVVVAEAPVAPGALEESEAVESRVDLRLEGENLVVLRERARVIELAVEDGLCLGHVGVGHEATVRVVLENALEPGAGVVFLALLEREKAVDVEREIVLLEPGIVVDDAAEEIARDAVVELGRWASLVDGFLVPLLEARDEQLALVFPVKLSEANERLGHLARLARRLGDERVEKVDGLRAKFPLLDHVSLHARFEPRLQLHAKCLRELGSADHGLPRALRVGTPTSPLRRRLRLRGEGPLRRRRDGLTRRWGWQGRRRRGRRSRSLRRCGACDSAGRARDERDPCRECKQGAGARGRGLAHDALLHLAADVLVRPIVSFERPVLLVVFEEPRGIERIDGVLRQVPHSYRFHLDLERSFAPEDALDASETRASQKTRQSKIEAMQRVLGEGGLRMRQVVTLCRDP